MTPPETLSRNLAQLRRQGLLQLHDNRFTLPPTPTGTRDHRPVTTICNDPGGAGPGTCTCLAWRVATPGKPCRTQHLVPLSQLKSEPAKTALCAIIPTQVMEPDRFAHHPARKQ